METSSCGIYVKELKTGGILVEERTHEYKIQQEWFRQIKPEMEWKTEEGYKVRILSPGYHNLYGGPDFKDALVEINGSVFRGDIEIHQKAGDWYQHGHHKDERYNRVLLHIVLVKEKNFTGTVNLRGSVIPTLALPHFFIKTEDIFPEGEETTDKITSFHIPPCLEQIQFDYEILVRILSHQRVLRKIEQMRIRLQEVSLDEMIYEFLFYGLGIGTKYAELYMNLARMVPYPQAKVWLSEDPRILESVLLYRIGYLQKGVKLRNPYALMLEDIRKQYDTDTFWVNSFHEDKLYSGISVYPHATPACRIACMVSFLSKVEGLLSEFLYTLWEQSLKINSPWILWEKFFTIYHYYWSYYNNWEIKRNRIPHFLIGRERVYSILGNILIPFFLLSSQEGLWGQREEGIWNVYYRLPGENSHWLLKRMKIHAEFLFSRKYLRFFEQQALIQWYKTGCSIHPQCMDCHWKEGKNIPNNTSF